MTLVNFDNSISEMKHKIKVAELFAGVGGFRLGLEGVPTKDGTPNKKQPYEVVFSNQWEPSTKRQHANEVYEARFGGKGHSGDDIATVHVDDIPNHDLLVGGFPCQDYSVATSLRSSKGLQGKCTSSKKLNYWFTPNLSKIGDLIEHVI